MQRQRPQCSCIQPLYPLFERFDSVQSYFLQDKTKQDKARKGEARRREATQLFNNVDSKRKQIKFWASSFLRFGVLVCKGLIMIIKIPQIYQSACTFSTNYCFVFLCTTVYILPLPCRSQLLVVNLSFSF